MATIYLEIMDTDTLAARIESARTAAGLQKQQLAQRARVSPGAITQYENGQIQRIGADVLLRIARACGVTVDWLLEGQGEQQVAEGRAAYGAGELAQIWSRLTSAQRAELEARARDMAAGNEEILRELRKRETGT
jgi:transcriptional regulator with XRE-family HTH domain